MSDDEFDYNLFPDNLGDIMQRLDLEHASFMTAINEIVEAEKGDVGVHVLEKYDEAIEIMFSAIEQVGRWREEDPDGAERVSKEFRTWVYYLFDRRYRLVWRVEQGQ